MSGELTDAQQTELADALIAADDVLNVLLQSGVTSVQGRPVGCVYEAWRKVRDCAWLYEQQWYAERGMVRSFEELREARNAREAVVGAVEEPSHEQ